MYACRYMYLSRYILKNTHAQFMNCPPALYAINI